MKNKIVVGLLIFIISTISFAQNGSTNYKIENNYTTIDSTSLSKDEKSMGVFDYLDIIKEIVTIAGLALGIFWGFPILRKKLQEDHIKKLIEETQQNNKAIREECHKLIEKHSTKAYKNRPVEYKELQEIYLEIRNIDLKAADTSKEIASLVYLLKNTFQGVLRHYDPPNTILLTSVDIYSFYLSILSELIFFATKVVTLPKKASTTKFRLINKKVEPFLTDNKFNKYKYFEIGLDIKYASPITFLYFSHINNSSSYLFQRAAYQIVSNPAPIVRLLFLNKIYLPAILERNKKFALFNPDAKLYLIGFQFMVSYTTTETKKTIDAYYSNLEDVIHFVKSTVSKKSLSTDFKDAYIDKSKFDFSKINSFSTHNPEILKISLDEDYVKDLFENNKKEMKKKMKEELKRT